MFSLDVPSCSNCHSATESAENIGFELHAQNLICCLLTHKNARKTFSWEKHTRRELLASGMSYDDK